MIFVERVNQSRQVLKLFLRDFGHNISPLVDREQVVAFATLYALKGHFPELFTEEEKSLIVRAAVIKTIEPDRFYKQRRIAIQKILQEYRKP